MQLIGFLIWVLVAAQRRISSRLEPSIKTFIHFMHHQLNACKLQRQRDAQFGLLKLSVMVVLVRYCSTGCIQNILLKQIFVLRSLLKI